MDGLCSIFSQLLSRIEIVPIASPGLGPFGAALFESEMFLVGRKLRLPPVKEFQPFFLMFCERLVFIEVCQNKFEKMVFSPG